MLASIASIQDAAPPVLPLPPHRAWQRLALFMPPLLNLLLLTFLVFHYAIDAPDWDQWHFIPFLDRAYSHQLTLRDFWAQHNEHRLLFPRLIMLICARLSGWNIRWELAVNLLLALGIYGVYVRLIRRSAAQSGYAAFGNLIPVAGLIVFSLRQWQNWTWGWQLQIFLNVLAVVAGVAALTRAGNGWGRVWAGIGCGIVATYSFGNGLLFWFVGAFVLLCAPADPRKKPQGAVWGVVALLVIASYLHHYDRGSATLPFAAHHPFAVLLYVCAYLGSLPAIKASVWLALPIGIAGLALCGWAARGLLRDGRTPRAVLVPYFALALYTLLSALVSGMGRALLGTQQALESRYTTISALFWIAALALALLHLRPTPNGADRPPAPRAPQRGTLVLVAFGVWIALISVKDTHQFKDHYALLSGDQERLRQGRADIPYLVEPECRQAAPEYIRILQDRHLTVFRH